MDRDFVSRRTGRAVPSTSVTVALLDDNVPVAYGIVRDLSEIGACIMTDALLEPGTTLQFRMSFFSGDVLRAEARVVWSETRGPGASPSSVEIPHGFEFTEIGGGHLTNLRRLLRSGLADES